MRSLAGRPPSAAGGTGFHGSFPVQGSVPELVGSPGTTSLAAPSALVLSVIPIWVAYALGPLCELLCHQSDCHSLATQSQFESQLLQESLFLHASSPERLELARSCAWSRLAFLSEGGPLVPSIVFKSSMLSSMAPVTNCANSRSHSQSKRQVFSLGTHAKALTWATGGGRINWLETLGQMRMCSHQVNCHIQHQARILISR